MSKGQNKLTGTILFRDVSDSKNVAGPGRKLMAVIGIVAVPEDYPIEHQKIYPVEATGFGMAGIPLRVATNQGYDIPIENAHNGHKEEFETWTHGQFFVFPIWKV